MPFVGASTSMQALIDTFLAKTKTKYRIKKPSNPTAGRLLPATVIYNCNDAQQKAVKDTFSRVATAYVPEIRRWGGAGPTLANRLEQFNLGNTWVSCKDCSPYASLSFEDGGNGYPEIRVCRPVPQYESDFKRLVFQELLVLAKANLFDVYIVQAYFRSWDLHNGMVPAGKWDAPQDFLTLCRVGRRLTGMYAGSLAGNYMVWTPFQGKVYVGKTVTPSEPGMQLINQTNWSHACS